MGKRAPNGMGTIRERKDGRWEGRYTAPDGRQRSVYAVGKKEVIDKLKKATALMTLGTWFEPSKITTEAWLRMWLKDYATNIKPTTRENYTKYMENHVIPAIGKIKLSRLGAVHVQRMFGEMARNGKSAGTQSAVRIALSSAMSAAVKFKLIQENPCKGVKIGKTEEKEMVIVDRPDMPLFVLAAKQSQYYAAMMVLLQTGIRTGELRGLRWRDVDLDAKQITICQQISDIKAGPIIQSTKGYSKRRIIIIDETVKILRAHKKAQAETRLKNGWKDNDLTRDLVFRMQDGSAYPRTVLNWAVKKAGRMAGIEGLHPHSLRDSYAIAAMRSGVDVKTVQNNLGHKDATMTLNTYAKYTDDAGEVAALKFAEYWANNAQV